MLGDMAGAGGRVPASNDENSEFELTPGATISKATGAGVVASKLSITVPANPAWMSPDSTTRFLMPSVLR